MKANRNVRRLVTAGLATGALLAGVGTAAAASVSPKATTGVIKVASNTTATPNWAYPYMSGAYFSVSNINQFEQMMYRPLYFFGTGSTINLNPALSLAALPVYSAGNTVVTVTLKSGIKWSNGQALQPKDVLLWMNLLAAFPGRWADYIPPLPNGQKLGIPDDVKNITVSGNSVVFHLSNSVSPQWFTYNELSQITPMPAAWDLMHTGGTRVGLHSVTGGNDTTTSAGCWSTTWVGQGNNGPSTTYQDPFGDNTVVTASHIALADNCVSEVYEMRALSADTADYTTAGTDVARLWGIVDGPWKMHSYNVGTGSITLIPNTAPGASGQRPYATSFQFVPCTGDLNCYNLLQSKTVDQGGLPAIYAPKISSLANAGKSNPVAGKGYKENPVYSWVVNYFPYNFHSTKGANGHAGSVFKQLYFRQAFQHVVDQTGGIKNYFNGYGYPTYGPIPVKPANTYTHLKTNPYAFSVSSAKSLLAAHGWHVVPGGTTTCTTSSKCGAGIPNGTPLSFTLEYASGSTELDHLMAALKSNAAAVGIQLATPSVTFNTVIGDAYCGCGNWDLANWGGGWLFAPDYYPSGEALFATGSGSNAGAYSDAHADALIQASINTNVSLATYETYIAQQLPVVWQPNGVGLAETKTTLHGVNFTPLQTLTPEYWHR